MILESECIFILLCKSIFVCDRELENQVAVTDKQRLNHMEHQQMIVAKCEKVKEALREVLQELDGYKAQLMAAQSKQERLLKELQMTKEKEAIFMDQRSIGHTQKRQQHSKWTNILCEYNGYK